MLRTCTRLWYLLTLAALLLGYRPARAQQERVGIGTTTPTQALDVKGNLRVRPLRPPGGNQLLVAQPDGTLGLSKPLAATAGLGLHAQVAGTTPVMVGSVGSGPAYAQVAAAGRYVFVGGGTQLRTYDAQAVPVIPAYVTNTTLSGTVRALATNGSVVYAVTSTELELFGLSSSPSLALTRQASVPLTPAGTTSTTIFDAVLAGSYLYVAASFSGSVYGTAAVVRVFDLTNPVRPVAAATLPLGLTGRVQLAADESRGHLLVAPDAGPLQVYALATSVVPTPAPLATAPVAVLPTFGGGLAVVGGILYGANNATAPPTLAVYDAGSPADPSEPVSLGAVPLPKPVQDLAVAGSYAYLLTADASSYQLVAVRVAAPALVGLDAAGNVASVAPVLLPSDDLGNHSATQNLNLGNSSLVSNGSQGLYILSNGEVGVPSPRLGYRLAVTGTLQTTSITTTGLLSGSTLIALDSVVTPSLIALGTATGSRSRLAAATGRVTGTGARLAGSSNYTVARNGPGSYRLTFTAGPLATSNLQRAAFIGALAGSTGFVTFTTTSTNNYIDVYTSATNGALSDRAFTFSVFLP